MKILFVLVLAIVVYAIPVLSTALFLEWRDRKRIRQKMERLGDLPNIKLDYPSTGSRAWKIALAWTVILAVVIRMSLSLGFRPIEELMRFVLFYIVAYMTAYFCVWLIRKMWKSDFKVEAPDGEDVAYVPLDELTEKQRGSNKSYWRAAAAISVFTGIVILIVLFLLPYFQWRAFESGLDRIDR